MIGNGPLPAYIEGLINFGGVMTVRTADEGRYLLVNPTFEELLGLPAADIVGRTAHELYPPAMADAVLAGDSEVVRGSIARTRLEVVQDARGENRHFLVHKFPVLDPDGVAFAVLIMNLAVPLIDRYTIPRIYGHAR